MVTTRAWGSDGLTCFGGESRGAECPKPVCSIGPYPPGAALHPWHLLTVKQEFQAVEIK